MTWLTRADVGVDIVARNGIDDSYQWHKRFYNFFPINPTQGRDFLCRADIIGKNVRVWLLSQREPICPDWCPTTGFVSKSISPGFLNHSLYTFDLKACPTHSKLEWNNGLPVGDNGKLLRGKRMYISDHQKLLQWIERKGLIGGFEIEQIEISPVVMSYFRKSNRDGFNASVQFRGTLIVKDQNKFTQTYYQGIGSAKGFGYGMLLLAPLH